jgi:hypothetical protein
MFDASHVIEDFCTIADCLGFDVSPRGVEYSGFWSQGDGASFTGSYSYRKGCVAAIMAHAPKDATLHAIARDIVAMQRPAFYRIEGAIYRISHRYSHECTIRADSDELTEIARRLCQWLYKALESEYEYQQACAAGSEYQYQGAIVKDAKEQLRAILAERRAVKGIAAPALCGAIRQSVSRILSDIADARKERALLIAGDHSNYCFYTGNADLVAAFQDGAQC